MCGRRTAAKRPQSVIGSFLLPVPVHLRTREDASPPVLAYGDRGRRACVLKERREHSRKRLQVRFRVEARPGRLRSRAALGKVPRGLRPTSKTGWLGLRPASFLEALLSAKYMPQAARTIGLPRPISRMGRGYIGLGFDIGSGLTIFSGDTVFTVFFLDPGEAFLTPPLARGTAIDWRGPAMDCRLAATMGAAIAAAGGAAGGCVRKRGESAASDCIGTGPTTRSATYSPTASMSRLGDAIRDFRASISRSDSAERFSKVRTAG
jgi:hypothetical protein